MANRYDYDRYYIDSDMPDYEKIAQRTHIAKKEHKCLTCGDTIKPVEKYDIHIYKCDGIFYVDKTHHNSACWAKIEAEEMEKIEKQERELQKYWKELNEESEDTAS